jgi:geranylgeranyl pyrophosphate synthase
MTMALEQPSTDRTLSPAAAAPPAAPTTRPLAALLGPRALAALVPAAEVPMVLWRKVLVDPVQELLLRPGKGFRARLTEIAFRLAGGQGQPPPALAAMLEVVHAGSMIVDDIEDDSIERRGGPTVHRIHGVPIALNAGNWMYFAPFALLRDLGLGADDELHLHRRISRVLLDCHFGQALDLGARPGEVSQSQIADVVKTTSVLKTGRLLALAAEAGAITAGASGACAIAIADFGEALGVGLQMLDDLGNLSGRAPADKRYEDLRCGRLTWPWAWAASQLDEAKFAGLVAERDRLGREESADAGRARRSARWQPLAVSLRGLVGAHGRLAAHWHLREALCQLRDDLNAPPAADAAASAPVMDALEREIARLEASYG